MILVYLCKRRGGEKTKKYTTFQTFICFIIYIPIVKGEPVTLVTPCHYFSTDLSHLHNIKKQPKNKVKIHKYTFNV